MIRTLLRVIATDNHENKEYVEIACLSTDSKPTTGIITGSVIYEVDTGKRYEFNETASTWVEQPASGGGGLPPVTAEDNGKVLGVEDGAWSPVEAPEDVFLVTFDYANQTCDHTYSEISAALNAKKFVMFRMDANAVATYVGSDFDMSTYQISIIGTTAPVNGYYYRMTVTQYNSVSVVRLPFPSIVPLQGNGGAYNMSAPQDTQLANPVFTVGDVVKAGAIRFARQNNNDYKMGIKYYDLVLADYSMMMQGTKHNIIIKDAYTGDLWATGFVEDTATLTFTPYTP